MALKPVKLSEKNKDFFALVHEVARLVPYGRVTSYGAIAKYLGSARSSRMVGWAMNAAHGDDSIPAHRVVNRIGMLSGKMHFGHPDRMQTLLESEGISVIDDQVQEFEKLFWDPMKELRL